MAEVSQQRLSGPTPLVIGSRSTKPKRSPKQRVARCHIRPRTHEPVAVTSQDMSARQTSHRKIGQAETTRSMRAEERCTTAHHQVDFSDPFGSGFLDGIEHSIDLTLLSRRPSR